MNALVKVGDQAKALIGEITDDLQLALGDMPIDRFRSTFITAVSHTPELLNADPQSLKTALMKCANDRLMPDGREATIQIYNTKEKGPKGEEIWVKKAQYMPMVFGIRKRAKELGGIGEIICECVYENDFFECVMGDDPYIKHKPTEFGKTRGEIIGVYAIFKDEKGKIVHREPMPKEDIEKARNSSKAKEGQAWKGFYGEMARKSVVRRGSKSVPTLPDDLRRIIERDDDYVDLEASSTPHIARSANPLIEDRTQRSGTTATSAPAGNEAGGPRNPGATDEVANHASDTHTDKAAGPSRAGQGGGMPPTDSNTQPSAEHGQTAAGSAAAAQTPSGAAAANYNFVGYSQALARATQKTSLKTFNTDYQNKNAWCGEENAIPTLRRIYEAHLNRVDGTLAGEDLSKTLKDLGAA